MTAGHLASSAHRGAPPGGPLAVLVTGVSGSGKSSLAIHLLRLGYDAVSLDGDPALCSWTDSAGRAITRPKAPDAQWLGAHRWVWNPERLQRPIEAPAPPGTGARWLCGRADNALDLADLFDQAVVLDIDETTMRRRLTTRTGGNDYGCCTDTLDHAVAQHATFRTMWRARGATVIDAAGPLDDVAARLVRAGR